MFSNKKYKFLDPLRWKWFIIFLIPSLTWDFLNFRWIPPSIILNFSQVNLGLFWCKPLPSPPPTIWIFILIPLFPQNILKEADINVVFKVLAKFGHYKDNKDIKKLCNFWIFVIQRSAWLAGVRWAVDKSNHFFFFLNLP